MKNNIIFYVAIMGLSALTQAIHASDQATTQQPPQSNPQECASIILEFRGQLIEQIRKARQLNQEYPRPDRTIHKDSIEHNAIKFKEIKKINEEQQEEPFIPYNLYNLSKEEQRLLKLSYTTTDFSMITPEHIVQNPNQTRACIEQLKTHVSALHGQERETILTVLRYILGSTDLLMNALPQELIDAKVKIACSLYGSAAGKARFEQEEQKRQEQSRLQPAPNPEPGN